MPSKLRFAIVGAGVIARFHAESILQKHADAELIAIADPSIEKARTLGDEFNVRHIFDDYETLLKLPEIDVVCICTPSGMHSEVSIAAAQAGKHVLCEKPLEINADKMTAMIEECRKQRVKLGCVFQRRLMPAALHARQAIQDGKLGKLVMGNAYLKYYRSPEYYGSGGWRGTWNLDGGGALMNQGVHGVDLIQFLMGDVSSVFAYTAPLVRSIEVEDTAVVAIKFKNGAFGVIQGSTSIYPGQETRFELHGDKGTIEFGDNGIKQWSFMDHEEEAPVIHDTLGLGSSSNPQQISIEGHCFYIDDMIRAIREDKEPHINGEEARKSVDLILAIYESSRSGKEIML
ncbi:gfo/Idh/MocA family oxidoreductase [Paenibacillus sp. LMG 31456]|uniref:Gfo/Idh/MocA family oxidoreductase n=1 Tax=Paenibacillus foliorum TaxID=2654974 RepID=A0A972GRC5_9BACL|nr:Gfo/Idh/MocA family oxidoreductase [Paenibacillus foliorum]NOU94978.1 gfo/Idh/MocA family oxidoreductase [Paenibacillus foliorum]